LIPIRQSSSSAETDGSAWPYGNSRRFLTSSLIGATAKDQLRYNIASADLQLSVEVEGVAAIHETHPNPGP